MHDQSCEIVMLIVIIIMLNSPLKYLNSAHLTTAKKLSLTRVKLEAKIIYIKMFYGKNNVCGVRS